MGFDVLHNGNSIGANFSKKPAVAIFHAVKDYDRNIFICTIF